MAITAQSEKDRKYDRQLRLWASTGQALLEHAHVALIGGTAVGSELLKDLILPNVGQFTVIDGEVVKDDVDLSANFFVEAENVGRPRALAVVENLAELNEDVKGFAIEKSLGQILAEEEDDIEKQKEFWKQFSVVIVSESLPLELLKLSDILWDLHIPLVVIDSFSFFGSIFISVPEHTVVESHPISHVDLRLNHVWSELEKLVASYDLASLDEVDHAHVPYPVLLLKYLEAWRHDHDGADPKTSAEKRQFKAFIDSMRSGTDQENYDEAIANAWHLYQNSTVSSEVQSILDNPQARKITPSSTKFWVLVAALRKFVVSEDSRLPLSGVLPDMKADTTGFLKLQTVYRQKAAADRALFKDLLHEILDSAGRSRDAITDDEIETFCKNSAHIKVVSGTNLRRIFVDTIHSNKNPDEDDEDELYLNDPTDQFHIYIAILAIKGYFEQYGAQAGRKAMDALEQERLNTIALNYIKLFGGTTVYPQTSKVLREMLVPKDTLAAYDAVGQPLEPRPSHKYTRHIAIRFAYLGWPYNGLAVQPNSLPNVRTVEGELLRALYKTRMIAAPDAHACALSRCGRTDKGVSGLRQVVSLKVRSVLDPASQNKPECDALELDYLHILNQVLPRDIRLYEICLRPPEGFDARFSCVYRHYKYFFRAPPGDGRQLDIGLMREAAQLFVGVHDFRNFCKVDGSKQISNFERTVISIDITPIVDSSGCNNGLYCLDLKGSAFLWHQVRSMMAILFLIGQKLETPSLITRLFDVTGEAVQRPVYEMAADTPLVLYDCVYDPVTVKWTSFKTLQSQHRLEDNVYDLWHENLLRFQMVDEFARMAMSSLHPPYAPITEIHSKKKKKNRQLGRLSVNLGNGVGKFFNKYIPVMDRERLETPDVINQRWLNRKKK